MDVARRKVLTLLLEMRCNSFCVFCGVREVDEAVIRSRKRLGLATPKTNFGALRGRYTLESATAELDRARREGYDELSLQGGEPTLFPQLPEVIAHARAIGFTFVGLVTNGRKLRDRVFAERVMTAGLHGITVSLLGADAATHDALQAVDGAFDELKAGLENVSSLVREGALPVSVNVNLIVSAKSVDSLARMVRLAMSLGAIAGSVHLVKFDSLGADPGVREPLRFDIRRMRGALLEGFAACADSGFRMHAADVPLCLHPKLTLDEVRRATARASIEGHAYSAAAFNFSGDSRNSGVDRAPCRTCLLKASCPRVPAEYLPDDPASALVALTESSIGAWVDETLASVDPSDDGSTRQLVVFGRTLRELAALTGDPAALSASRTKVREAIADLALVAAAEARTSRALPALLAYLGLDPPTTTPSFRGPIPKPRSFEPTSGALLQFIDGYRVWLQGHWESADSFAITSFEPLVPKDASQRMARLGHLFAAATTWVLWGAKRLRIARRAVEAERGEGKAREWATILMQDQEGAVTLRALSPDALARGPDV